MKPAFENIHPGKIRPPAGRISRLVNSIDFDYDSTDRGNPLTAELERDPAAIAGDGLERLMRWLWQSSDMKGSFIRFVAMSAAMRPELLDNQSYNDIAKKLNVTRATISSFAVQFQKKFGVHFRRSKRAGSSVKYAAARFYNRDSRVFTKGSRKFLNRK